MIKQIFISISLIAIVFAEDRTYNEVHLNYYQEGKYVGYAGTVCNLNYYGHRKERYLTFNEIKSLDPELHCTEKEVKRCHPMAGCRVVGHEVNCMIDSSYSKPVSCEKVKRICEDGMLGGLQYGTCVKVERPKGDCCYKLNDPVTGYWTKDREGKCPFLCLGVVDPLGGQWCKSCSCDNSDSGTGQGGTKSYGDLC